MSFKDETVFFVACFLKEMRYRLRCYGIFQKTICVQSINKNKVSETPTSYIRQKSSLFLLYSNDGWSVLYHSALKIEKQTVQKMCKNTADCIEKDLEYTWLDLPGLIQ